MSYEEREKAIARLRELDFRLRHLPAESPTRPELEEEREGIVEALGHDEESKALARG